MKRSDRQDPHGRALASIGYALTLKEQPEAWCGLSIVLEARLSPYERACLLVSVANACDADLLIEVTEATIPTRVVGTPLPVLCNIKEDARWWADNATLPEIREWLAACFVRLSAQEQRAFLQHAGRRVAA